MKLSDFILLNGIQKKLIALHEGILIGKRNDKNHMVFLFQLENFYVETFCNHKNKEVEEFRVFTGIQPLYPYLENIAIDDLFH